MNTAAASFMPAFHPALADHHPAGAVSWREMLSHRDYLVRFAQRKLHDPMLAEDVVHDVFEAVIAGRASFAGRSALRSWLTAILKNKIVDLVRQRAGLQSLEDDGDDESTGVAAIECPHARPDELAELRQTLARTLAHIEALPAGLRDVMRLRVLNDQPTDEVCRALSISEENLFVRLHRARKQLLS
ncbi:RNA polymerase sigma factor [Piscinibacter sp.]|uniref:RNA polymerase sigma factor n=1 Tax=Piscinibacter sp. TaxID=1903157 RepID=UPI002CE5F6DA|nr:sigma-70 family RNA polymerase sigma factor [Albitalea sp.]HUG25453.1 sigma-70 family RNA polymerase sigma factor [Albitalea sp.]